MIRMWVLLLSLLCPVVDETVVYRAPEGADPDDLSLAAQALVARCKAYGYKGIHAVVLDNVCSKYIHVTCATGFTPEMKRTLNVFARLSASSVELRFPAVLTDVEKEQYQSRPNPAQDTAPQGTQWHRCWNSEEAPVLLRKAPLVTRSDLALREVKDRNGGVRRIWEISSLQTRAIRAAEKKGKLGSPSLLVDGWVVEEVVLNAFEKNEEGKTVPAERMSFTSVSRVLREVLAYPMPVALEPIDELVEKN